MPKKILIVDDSRTIRQQVNFTLSKGGFEVIEAEDGNDGLKKLSENIAVIGLVISDINMPGMGGLEMIENIQANPAYANIPIIMLTTEGSSELIERAKKANAKGWLVKPFKPEQLVAVAQKLVA